MFSYFYLFLLAILAYYDIKNQKTVPDFLVYAFFIIGIIEAIIKDQILILLLSTLVIFGLHKLGVFGDAEIFIIPPLIINLSYKALDLLVISSTLVIAYSFSLSFTILIILVMYLNPLLAIFLSYLGFIVWRDKLKLYELRKVDLDVLGEYTIEGRFIDYDYFKKNSGKLVIIKKSIPYLPILFFSYLLVLYTEISFLKFLLPHL